MPESAPRISEKAMTEGAKWLFEDSRPNKRWEQADTATRDFYCAKIVGLSTAILPLLCGELHETTKLLRAEEECRQGCEDELKKAEQELEQVREELRLTEEERSSRERLGNRYLEEKNDLAQQLSQVRAEVENSSDAECAPKLKKKLAAILDSAPSVAGGDEKGSGVEGRRIQVCVNCWTVIRNDGAACECERKGQCRYHVDFVPAPDHLKPQRYREQDKGGTDVQSRVRSGSTGGRDDQDHRSHRRADHAQAGRTGEPQDGSRPDAGQDVARSRGPREIAEQSCGCDVSTCPNWPDCQEMGAGWKDSHHGAPEPDYDRP